MAAEKQNHFDIVKITVTPALQHFDKPTVATDLKQRLLSAADIACSNSLLFEKFEMWNAEKDDDIFLFHINRFFDNIDRKSLTVSERDLTSQRENVEASIKEDVRSQQKKIFGERITALALKHNLLRNEDLGTFLEVSPEQARNYKAGENKPQLATLKKIADKFKVSVGYLVGLE